MRPVVVAGAGIGGLTAALALAARGMRCVVLERSSVLAAAGAGIQLSPNASRILIALGLRDALAACATLPEAVVLNSVRAGGTIARLPLMPAADAPYWVIHRADLQAVLRAAVEAHPAITLRLGAAVDDVDMRDEGVNIIVGGKATEAAALIGADGVGSRIRQNLFPGSPPQSSGRAAWRGFAAQSPVPGPPDVQLWMGAGAHLVAYPVTGGGRINLVVTLPDDNDNVSEQTGGAVAARLAQAGWPKCPCDLIASAATLTRYPLLTVPPLRAWNAGPVALIGDAAHAMLPFAAQGAAMAIEDADVLARSLAEQPADVLAALARYSDARRPRVGRVADAARQSGRIYHMRGAMALARDVAIRALGGRLLLKRQNWIYDWKP